MSFIFNLITKFRLARGKLLNKRFKPDFSDDYFISLLSETNTILKNAKKKYSNGDFNESKGLIAKYFRTRSEPCFFLNVNDVEILFGKVINDHPEWCNQTLESVRKMLAEGINVFSYKTELTSSVAFWRNLEKGIGQDVLYQVKPHRFYFAPQFIRAQHYGEPTLEVFDQIITSWLKIACKDSLAYLSDLTVISRLISLSWAWFFLTALDDEAYPEKCYLEYKLLKIIHVDAVFLSKIKNQSAPNNHLMIYEFSRFYIGTLFPEFTDLNEWTRFQPDSWVSELKRQTYSDGGGFEQSLHYHQLFCETAIAYVLLCKKNSLTPDSWVEKHLELFLNFQITLGGLSCTPLHIGDSSDHELFPIGSVGDSPLANLREIYRFLYQPNLVPTNGNKLNFEKAFWLLSGQIVSTPEPGTEKNENQFYEFSESGYYIFNGPNSLARLIFRTGPSVNSNVFAGHMHADLLSIYVIVNGIPFIVNSGTYTYRSNINNWPPGTPAWRKFFMGAESKNTLFIDNEDPLGDINGDFRNPTTQVRVKTTILHHRPEINWIEAEIIGANNYSHFRRGIINLVDNYWIVYDVKGTGNAVNMGLQLAEKVELEQYENSIAMHQKSAYLNMAWSSSLHLSEKLKGSLSPLGGWISEKYGELKAATYLKFKIEIDKELAAVVFISGKMSPPAISVPTSLFDKEVTKLEVKTESFTDYIFYRNDGYSGLIISDKPALNANAAILVVRFDINNKPLFLKAINVVDVSFPEIGLVIKCKNIIPWVTHSLIERSHINDGNMLVEWV